MNLLLRKVQETAGKTNTIAKCQNLCWVHISVSIYFHVIVFLVLQKLYLAVNFSIFMKRIFISFSFSHGVLKIFEYILWQPIEVGICYCSECLLFSIYKWSWKKRYNMYQLSFLDDHLRRYGIGHYLTVGNECFLNKQNCMDDVQ